MCAFHVSRFTFQDVLSFIYGKDTYRSHEYLQEFIGIYRKKYPEGTDIHTLYGDRDTDIESHVRDRTRTASFFDEKKLIIVKHAFSGIRQADVFKELESDKDTTVVFYEYLGAAEAKKANKELFTALAGARPHKEFEPLSQNKVMQWIKRYAVSRGLSLPPHQVAALAREAGNDLWRLRNDLDKLAAFAYREEKKTVSDEVFGELVHRQETLNIFSTLDAAFAGDRARAVELTEKHLLNGDDPLYLIAMFAYHVRTLLSVKDLEERNVPSAQIAKKTKLHPFVLQKARRLTRQIPMDELRGYFSRIAAADEAVKLGKNPQMSIMEIFVHETAS